MHLHYVIHIKLCVLVAPGSMYVREWPGKQTQYIAKPYLLHRQRRVCLILVQSRRTITSNLTFEALFYVKLVLPLSLLPKKNTCCDCWKFSHGGCDYWWQQGHWFRSGETAFGHAQQPPWLQRVNHCMSQSKTGSWSSRKIGLSNLGMETCCWDPGGKMWQMLICIRSTPGCFAMEVGLLSLCREYSICGHVK